MANPIWQSRWRNRALSIALSLAAASSIVGGATLPSVETQPLDLAFNRSQSALATTSGGRSRGGSFGDDEPVEETRPAKSKRSRSYSESSYSRSNRDRNRYDDDYRSTNRSGDNSAMDAVMFFMFLIFVVYLIKSGTLNQFFESAKATATESETLAYSSATSQASSRTTSARTASRRLSTEITNNTVTVTQVQVAMLAQARHVQKALTQIAEETDMSNKTGLTKSLRETVLALLRAPETWTHAAAQSKTVTTKQAAKAEFESLSLEERSKFDVESLSNVDGKVRKQSTAQHNQDPAAYIVVTLIVGTAHDNPLLDRAMSVDELKAVLKKLGSITPDYLMVYEVLWSPQDESDSLTDDELMLNYPTLFRIG